MDRGNILSLVLGAIGGCIASLFGGWSSGMTTLVIFMAIDYITGLLVAGVFKASKKSETGGLKSYEGWKGLTRKGVSLLVIIVAYRLDLLMGSSYIRDTAIIGFTVNEAISIIENAGLMGLPLPAVISKAIDELSRKIDILSKEGTKNDGTGT